MKLPATIALRLSDAWKRYRYPMVIFISSRLAILVIAVLALSYGLPISAQHWDAVYYPHIAAHGYTYGGTEGNGNTIVFFPLYPLAIWFIHTFTGMSFILAGYVASCIFGLAACLALYHFAALWHRPTTGLMAVALVSFAPFSIFFSATYAESLLLFLVTLSLYFLWQKRLVAASIPIGLALITKATAFALLPCLGLLLLSRSIALRTKIVAAALSAAPFAAFMLYQWIVFKTPLAFLGAEHIGWHKTLAWPWTGLAAVAQQFSLSHGSLHTMWIVESVTLTLACALCAYGLRHLPWTSSLFALGALILVISTNWPLSLARYVHAITPLYLSGAVLLTRTPYTRLWLFPVMAIIMSFFTLEFLLGGYVL